MKAKLIMAVILITAVSLFSCGTEDALDINETGFSGPEEYYETVVDYWDSFLGADLSDPSIDLFGQIYTVAGMVEEYFEMVIWNSNDGVWVYEYISGDVVTRVEIDTQNNGEEVPVYWSVKELDVLLWEGNAKYHVINNSLQVLFTTDELKLWFEFVESSAGDGYFTYIVYEDISEAEIYIGKMWFVTDLTYMTGRINTDYPVEYPSFELFTGNVDHIYNNPPVSWETWNTMPISDVYFEFSWDPVNGYESQWVGVL